MSINNKRSYTEYTVTQPTTDFAIGFDDFDEGGKDNILVTLNGVLVESLGYAAIRKNESTVTITPAITEGTVRLTRETDIDEPFHKFTAGALFSAKSMDENFQQVRHSQQEVRDGFVFLEYNTNGIVQASKEATAQAKAATVEATASAVRAETAADTAVQAVDSLQGVVIAATTATTNANAATATANTAASQATAATTSAQNAAQAANTAKQEATTAAANANAATVDTLAATGRANEAADVVADLVVGKVRAQDVSTSDDSTQDVKNTEFRNELDALPFDVNNKLPSSESTYKLDNLYAAVRTVFSKLGDSVHVKDFGAKTIQEQAGFNSTFAFVAALNYINAAGKGGELILGGGTYYIDPLDLRPYNNIRIVGACPQKYPYNARTVLLMASEGEIALQTVEYAAPNALYFAKGVEIKNIYLNCNNKTDYGITCKLETTIDGCSIRYAKKDGIVLVGTMFPVTIRNSTSMGHGRYGLHVKAPFSTIFVIDGLECNLNDGYGVLIEDGSTASIKNLFVQSNKQGGMKIIQKEPEFPEYPIFLERLAFDGFYSEGNGTLEVTDPNYDGNVALFIQGLNNDITTQVGKIPELSFVNSSVNKSSMGIASKISGTQGLRVQTSSGIVVDPLTNILGIETKGGHLFPITMPEHPPLRNVLDFFEQGVLGATIEAQIGTITLTSPLLVNYTVIGTLLTFSLVVSVASVTPDIAGTVTIKGLPYIARGVSAFSIYANFMGAHDLNMQASINPFTNAIVIRGFGGGISNTIGQYIKADTEIIISGSYTIGGR